MKIWIDYRAVDGSGNDDLLRSGALYALRRLVEMNYPLGCDADKLTERQQELLENEQIGFMDITKSGADLIAALDPQGDLILSSKNGNMQLASGKDWIALVQQFLFPTRSVQHHRKTAETEIDLVLNLDGTGKSDIRTGLRFFDHMLDQIAKHGLIDLTLTCDGDLEIDEHHTIEDVAITLGEAIYKVCGEDKTGIQRYGFLLAMDESQAEIVLDLSNRPYLVWNAEFSREYVGDFPLEMAEHFFHTLAMNAKATLQIRASGNNDHHKLESIFKGFARALRFSVTRTERSKGIIPSSKGKL